MELSSVVKLRWDDCLYDVVIPTITPDTTYLNRVSEFKKRIFEITGVPERNQFLTAVGAWEGIIF